MTRAAISARSQRLFGCGWLLSLLIFSAVSTLPSFAQIEPGQKPQTTMLQADLSLVKLIAAVVDDQGRPIADLTRDDFKVSEDGVDQEIVLFQNEADIPISVGIIFDTSGSMIDKLDGVEDGVLHFIDKCNPQDDFFVMRFASTWSLAQDFTNDRRQLRTVVRDLQASGSTALYDAIVNGLQYVKLGRHEKKALLLITDGNDTASPFPFKSAVDIAVANEVPIYVLALGHGEQGSFGHAGESFKDTIDVEALAAFTDATGGRIFVLEGEHHAKGVDKIDSACAEIALELRQRYTLGYYSSNGATDATYRKIHADIKKSGLKVRTRAGYYSTRNSR